MTGPHRDRSGTPTATIPNTGNHPERPARRRPYVNLYLQPLRQEVLMVVGFMSLPDEHAPSVESRIRRVQVRGRTLG
jgi:hypothetical protein